MNIHEKLTLIQQELKAPKNRKNSFGNYNYRSCEDILEAVKPLLAQRRCSLVLDDDVLQVGTRVYVRATATLVNHELVDETVTTHAYAREQETKKGMDDAQITGTASSYARKYALNGLFAIDDTKDADTDEYTNQTRGTRQQRQENKMLFKCASCGCEITGATYNGQSFTPRAIAEQTTKKLGRALCWNCYMQEQLQAQHDA
uniref:ERF superfamily protein n=1 Tax=Siphoviridae sp. ctSMg55 TaxID=2825509 RepID=A0A8S5V4Z6_9CAUD|nr:MAG TPA: ERF superfamily protein [Siphoviridae sp. ctSMg55]